MSFIVYDVAFLVLFTLLAGIFLYIRRNNLKRDGILYLYPTQFGINLIERTSKKYARILRPMQYVAVGSGYILMIAMIWLLVKLSYYYLTSPSLAQQLRVPVLMPLIPYIDKLFAVDFLPSFYFTYWIIVIAIIAIPHEFAHGIFARLSKVKIKSTGFGFLGPLVADIIVAFYTKSKKAFRTYSIIILTIIVLAVVLQKYFLLFFLIMPFLAAFVEQDDKQMNKAPRFQQLAILAAGTFANVVMTILFAIILWVFIVATFVPAGVYFNTYATTTIATSELAEVNGIPINESQGFLALTNESLISLTSNGTGYFAVPQQIARTIREQRPAITVYEDTPAINARLKGAIVAVDGAPVTSYDTLRSIIISHAPGDNITVTTKDDEGKKQHFHVTLADRDGKPYLGIGVIPLQARGVRGFVYKLITVVRDPMIYYESRLGDFGIFIYDLLWWIVVINISVALCNMLPVGIFDGGRFFYLTIWGITGSQKAGEQAFKWSTWIILAIVTLLMVKWAFVIF